MTVTERQLNEATDRLREHYRVGGTCLCPYDANRPQKILDLAWCAHTFTELYPKQPRPTPVQRPASGPSPMTGVFGIYKDAVHPARWFWTQGTQAEVWCESSERSDWSFGPRDNTRYLHCSPHQYCYATEAEAKLALHWHIWDQFVVKVKALLA